MYRYWTSCSKIIPMYFVLKFFWLFTTNIQKYNWTYILYLVYYFKSICLSSIGLQFVLRLDCSVKHLSISYYLPQSQCPYMCSWSYHVLIMMTKFILSASLGTCYNTQFIPQGINSYPRDILPKIFCHGFSRGTSSAATDK